MITVNGIQYRNLEEQVLENKQKIAEHYNIDRVLADFGIRVIGQIRTATLLPDPETFVGNYGDAYAVGPQAPYSFYVWTRADINSGHPNDYWLDIGELAIVGPQGPAGQEGPQGPEGKSSRWYVANQDPNNIYPTANEGDMCIIPNSSTASLIGNIYQWFVSTLSWNLVGNIRGSQGPAGATGPAGAQGPQGNPGAQGPKGDTGGFVKIWGILNSISDLPAPSTLNDLTVAYLVGATTPYDLWIQVGSTSANAQWKNQGLLNAGTAITVGGVFVDTFNADTKLNVPSNTTFTDNVVAYTTGVSDNTNNQTISFIDSTSAIDSVPTGSIKVPAYDSGGHLTTTRPDGIDGTQAINMDYYTNNVGPDSFDFNKDNFVNTVSSSSRIRCYCANTTAGGGGNVMIPIESAAVASSYIYRRDSTGHISILEPTDDQHPTTKKYVDDLVAASGGGGGGGGSTPLYDVQWLFQGYNSGESYSVYLHTIESTDCANATVWDLLSRPSFTYSAFGFATTSPVIAVASEQDAIINAITVQGAYIELSSATLTTKARQI